MLDRARYRASWRSLVNLATPQSCPQPGADVEPRPDTASVLTSRNELARVLEVGNGLLVARDHPELVRTAQRLTAAGALKAVLPGVFADPEAVGRPELRIQAL